MTGNSYQVGGLVGELDGAPSSISDSYSTGSVTNTLNNGNDNGGLVGGLYQASIYRSYSRARVIGDVNSGGLVGTMYLGDSSIHDSFAVGRVTPVNETSSGGLVGLFSTVNTSTQLVNDLYDAGRAGQGVCGNLDGLPGYAINNCTAADSAFSNLNYFKSGSINAPYDAWDFSTVWQVVDGGYPGLISIVGDELAVDDTPVAPGLPTSLDSPANTASSVSLSWNAPAADGGTSVLNYAIQYKLTSAPDWITFSHDVSQLSSITVTGLTVDASYDFRVAAINAIDQGGYTDLISVTPTRATTTFNNGSNLPVAFYGTIITPINFTHGESVAFTHYAVTAGSLPTGLTLDEDTGVLSGTPTEIADFAFTIRGTDDTYVAEHAFSMTVYPSQIYSITNCTDLQNMNRNPAGSYTLANDIDCSVTSAWNDAGEDGFLGFLPIANFTGSLKGNSHTIDGLYVHRTSTNNVGLFASTSNGASITNLQLTNENISGANFVAGLIGYAQQGTTVSWIGTSGTVSGDVSVGGLIGYAERQDNYLSINISNSTANMSISGIGTTANLGCLIGAIFSYVGNVTISNSSATCAITNGSAVNVGGLIGNADIQDGSGLTITSSSASGTIDNAGDKFGGLIGNFESSWLNLDASKPFLSITGSHSSVALTSGTNYIGGVIGMTSSTGTDVNVTISKSYFDGSISGFAGNEAGGIIGKVQDGTILIQYSYSSGNITSSIIMVGSHVSGGYIATPAGLQYIGGIVGYSETPQSLTIHDVYSSGNLRGTSNIGGIMGYGNGIISNAYASGDISNAIIIASIGSSNIGGIVGNFIDGSLTNSFSASDLSSLSIFENSYIGGVVGKYVDGSVTLTNNYYDAHNTGIADCSYYTVDDTAMANNQVDQCTAVNADNGTPQYFINNGGVDASPPLDTWSFPATWQTLASHYPVMDIVSLTPTLITPAAATTYRNVSPLPVSFVLPETMLSGSLQLTFIPNSGDNIVIHLSDVSPSVTHTINLTTTGGIGADTGVTSTTSDTIPVAHYRVVLSYQDMVGNPAVITSAENVWVDSPSPVITEVAPVAALTTIANAVYSFRVSKVCEPLAEPPTSTTGSVEIVVSDISDPAVVQTAQIRGVQIGGTYSFRFTCRDTDGNSANTVTVGPYTIVNSYSGGGGSGQGLLPPVPVPVLINSSNNFGGGQSVPQNEPFKDIIGHWSHDFVLALYDIKAVTGRMPHLYVPEGNLTRAEAVKIGLLTFGYKLDVTSPSGFTDLDAKAWYVPYLRKAKKEGFISGKTFHPNSSITRADTIVLFLEMAKKLEKAPAAPFSDVSQTAVYAPYINYAYAKGVVKGRTATTFEPNGSITRAEIAKVATQILGVK